MQDLHPGIRIDEIHVEGAGGGIFAAGITALFLIAVPPFIPLVGLCVVAGAVLAAVLHRHYY